MWLGAELCGLDVGRGGRFGMEGHMRSEGSHAGLKGHLQV